MKSPAAADLTTDVELAHKLLAVRNTGDPDQDLEYAFVALMHAADERAQQAEIALKGDDADLACADRRVIVRALVEDYGAGYIRKLAKEEDTGFEEDED